MERRFLKVITAVVLLGLIGFQNPEDTSMPNLSDILAAIQMHASKETTKSEDNEKPAATETPTTTSMPIATPKPSSTAIPKPVVPFMEMTIMSGDTELIYYINQRYEVVIVEGVGNLGENRNSTRTNQSVVVVPDEIDGYPVTEIAAYAFEGFDNTIEFKLPKGLKKIGSGAFMFCSSMRNIVIPDGVTVIEKETFCECTSLTEIVCPERLTVIEERAFADCTKLTDLVLSEGVTIGDYAFLRCWTLTNITLQDSLKEVDDSAFSGCKEIKNVYAPKGSSAAKWAKKYDGWDCTPSVKDISQKPKPTATPKPTVPPLEKTMMSDKTELTYYVNQDDEVVIVKGKINVNEDGDPTYAYQRIVTIPDEIDGYPVTEIGRAAFICFENTVEFKLPKGLKKIGKNAFECCYGLRSIAIPDGVTEIEDETFLNCYSLTEITWPKNLTTIGERAFWHCSSLTDVTIPEGVTIICSQAFDACSITDITFPISAKEIGSSVLLNNEPENIYVPKGSYAAKWAQKDDDIRLAVMFEGCSIKDSAEKPAPTPTPTPRPTATPKPTRIPTPEPTRKPNTTPTPAPVVEEVDVARLSRGIMRTGLPRKYYTKSVEDVFKKSYPVIIILPDEYMGYPVEIIENNGLYCSQIKGVKLPKYTKIIEESAFENCVDLKSIDIPSEVIEIGEEAFAGCGSLTEVTLPNSLLTIGPRAFYNDDNLLELDLPDSVTRIGAEAFYNCDSLTKIVLPNDLKELGRGAFQHCSGLTEIYFPEGLENIQSDYGIHRHASIDDRYSDIFYGCDNLEAIYAPAGSYAEKWLTEHGYTVLDPSKPKENIPAPVLVTEDAEISKYRIEDGNAIIEEIRNKTGYRKQTILVFPDEIDGYPITGIEGDVSDEGNRSVVEIRLPDGLIEIGQYAFQNYIKLEKVVLPDSITTIGRDAFYGCDSLIEIILPDNVTAIGRGAFSGCTNLENIKIPENVTIIGDSVFSNCESLTNMRLPDNVTTIGKYAFQNCDNLVEITIPNSVTIINERAFYDCDSLVKAVIGGDSAIVKKYAFYSCDSLTEVIILEGVREIEGLPFWNCDNLKSITLPDLDDGYDSGFEYGVIETIYLQADSFLIKYFERMKKERGYSYEIVIQK